MAVNLPYPYPSTDTEQWDPEALRRNLDFLVDVINRQIIGPGFLVPAGTVIMMTSGSSCPSGYTKISTGGGRYLRLSTGSGGGTGGSLNVSITDAGHTHGAGSYVAAATHAGTVEILASTPTTVTKSSHTHLVTGASGSKTTGITGTIAPTFLDVILCQKN